MLTTERLESMSPNGFLRLHRQEDGDIVLTIGESDDRGGFKSFSSAEFCTPFSGGGGSSRTYFALIQLMAAIAEDNLDAAQSGRKPPGIDDEEQQRIVEWGRQARKAQEDFLSAG
mgnify:CR=1 FL=1